jgi:hypothetical protein
MLRVLKAAAALLLALTMTGQVAHAQWGYGGWGWGGDWGATPYSADTAANGRFLVGAGIYNYDTALANQINAQTAMQVNDYMAQVTHEAAFMHAARRHEEFLRDRTLYDAHIQALRDNPTPQQIENGDALNQVVRDLSDPRLSSSSLRAADAPVPASFIGEVPFESSTERVTILLDKLRSAFKWPEVFEEPRFNNDKKLFDDVVSRLKTEDQEGDISPKTLREARQMVNDLDSKITAQPLRDEDDQKQAQRFVNTFRTLIGLLEKPDTAAALAKLRDLQDVRIGNLLGFMHAYNLRFAPATTRKQREIYHNLWETLDRTRDQVLADAKLDLRKPLPQRNPEVITDFYGRIRPKPTDSQNPPPPQ